MSFKTADICDNHPSKVSILSPGLQIYGGLKAFWGQIVTVQVHEDNVLIRKALSQDGSGKVLVVDGGGSLNCALIGDCMAKIATENNWSGIIINGCVRDTKELENFKFGVRALAANPRRSGKTGAGKIETLVYFLGVKIQTGQFVYADHDGILISNEKLF